MAHSMLGPEAAVRGGSSHRRGDSPATLSTAPVCIIGAGPSGLAVAKVLHQRGVPFQCYERSDRVGGLWAFDERDKTACYRSLQTNTSRTRTAFSDFPMPLDYPDYPGHWLMRSYFESYVEHFGFGQSVLFHTEVKHASARDGLWE